MPINRAFPFVFLAVIYVLFVTRLLLVFECKYLYLWR